MEAHSTLRDPERSKPRSRFAAGTETRAGAIASGSSLSSPRFRSSSSGRRGHREAGCKPLVGPVGLLFTRAFRSSQRVPNDRPVRIRQVGGVFEGLGTKIRRETEQAGDQVELMDEPKPQVERLHPLDKDARIDPAPAMGRRPRYRPKARERNRVASMAIR